MKFRQLGKNGPRVSEIGFGAWAIGGTMWGGRRDDDARASMERAWQLGVNFIDTALVYGMGHSERLVADFLKTHPEVQVATKVPPKCSLWPAKPGSDLNENFPANWITRCCEQSLSNLNIENIALLQLHVWSDNWTDREEWRREFEQLKQSGKIRLAGISINSNDPASAVRVVRSRKVDVVQVVYNVFEQAPEDELFPACIENGIGVIARVPLDEGSLSGKLRYDTSFPPEDFRSSYFGGDQLKETVDRVEALRPILAKSSGAMALSALRFCLSHPAVSTVIPGMRSTTQAEENCRASDEGPLSAEILNALRPHRWVRPAY